MSEHDGDARRRPAVLTIQLEDEPRVEHERAGVVTPASPALVERRLERALEALEGLGVGATFFAEGRLAAELRRDVWAPLVSRHELGCQGLARTSVARLGPDRFADDARRGREALADVAGVEVICFRAPDFSADDCEPWFGAGLRDAGYRRDASLRLQQLPEGSAGGCFALPGSDGAVLTLPMPMVPARVPVAGQKIMFLGSAMFRVLPPPTLRVVFELAEGAGFVPQVMLQLGDFDPDGPTGFEPDSEAARRGGWRARFEHLLRSTGREGVATKLQQLGWRWRFDSVAAATSSR
ncbi:MAG: polysaccharide deacetylase family protein [Nannocystaceae bacterium]